MCPKLTNKNVIDILLLAHLYNIDRLKSKCLDHFTSNCVDVVKRKADWKHLIANGSSVLFGQLYRRLAEKLLVTTQANTQQQEAIANLRQTRDNVDVSQYYNHERESILLYIADVCKILGWIVLLLLSIGWCIFVGFTISNGVSIAISFLVLCIVFVCSLVTICYYAKNNIK